MDTHISGKRAAAIKAASIVSEYSYGSVIGVGSGSTVKIFIDELKRLGLIDKYSYISTSYDTSLYLKNSGARSVETFACPIDIDVAVDGADEVDPELNLLKGGGGALFREKIVFKVSRRKIVIVDESKLVENLSAKHPIPIEVVPFSISYVSKIVRSIVEGDLSVRFSNGKLGPVITDNGNFIIDLKPRGYIDPLEIDQKLKMIDGVVATGVFPYDEYEVIVGYTDGSSKILKK